MKSSYFNHLLLIVVFLTGAAVLIVEVVATRILSPYFGNTIYTFSSVIGVILAALSLGYYFGGRLADQNPTLRWFFGIIYSAGLSIFFLETLIIFQLPIFGYKFTILTGPLFSSLILFFLPSTILGSLSPYAIALLNKHSPKQGVGTTSGLVFFWSTIGSIVGSLLTGFYLIPTFGVHQIIFSVGALLLVISLLGLLGAGVRRKVMFQLITVSALVMVLVLSFVLSIHHVSAVYDRDGVYEHITIRDGIFNNQPTRFFQQDKSMSAAMYLNSDEHVFDYTKYYALQTIFVSEVTKALVLGGGAYTVPKSLLKDLPQAQIDVVEIEPSLISLAQQYFELENNSRLTNYIQDGRRFLHDTSNQYDLIYSDVYYSIFSIPTHFTTREFFQLALDHLSEDGVFIANIIGNLSRQSPSFLLSEMRTFQSVFPQTYFFAVDSPGQSQSQNITFVGTTKKDIVNFSDPYFLDHENPLFRELAEKQLDVDRLELSQNIVFQDDYAPVDFYTSKLLQRETRKPYNNFEGAEALALIEQQLRYGPRYIGSEGHNKSVDFISAELDALVDTVHLQRWQHSSADQSQISLTNIIGRIRPELSRRILLGTHYDSKRFAELDHEHPFLSVPGANDSASGTAVLLELARSLANSNMQLNVGVDLVFFDGEEGEHDLSHTEWTPLGSTYFSNHLDQYYPRAHPESMIVIDMVCDKDLTIYKEGSSVQHAPELVDRFWRISSRTWPEIFKNQVRYTIGDDHTPLQIKGIPSMLIIDFEYPPFHTTEDIADKCSAASLEVVGKSLVDYLSSLD